MDKIFDLDSPFIQFLNRVADLMILNVVVMICSLPIVTAGAAYTAMHYVLLKMVRKEDGYLLRGFFKSFRQNFRQATIIWLGILALAMLYGIDFWIFKNSELEFSKIFLMLFMAVAVIAIVTAVYAFPVLARFDNSIRNILKNALSLAVINLPRTILMIILVLLPFALVYFFTPAWMLVFLFGISLPAYISAYIYSGIFKKFEPEESEVVSDYDFSINTGEGNEENG